MPINDRIPWTSNGSSVTTVSENGEPMTLELSGRVDDKLITNLSDDEQKLVLDWIHASFMPIKTVNKKHTSYGLKHLLQHETGLYLTNNQFKHAMLLSGYYPEKPGDRNWRFRISEKSPALKRTRDDDDRIKAVGWRNFAEMRRQSGTHD